jgi:hypothetical protein
MTKQPRDCAAAEVAYAKALADYPESSTISFNMGTALSCLKKNAAAIWEFERAAVLDPTLGGTKDAKQTQSIADGAYTRVHGSDEGLEQLKQQVKQSPLPPRGFAIKTATQILEEKEAEFEKSNPQLALWMKVKGALADANGAEYFESQLKNSAVPQLRGTLVTAKPACHPKELLVAVPLPDAPQPLQAEIYVEAGQAIGRKARGRHRISLGGRPGGLRPEPLHADDGGGSGENRGPEKYALCRPACPDGRSEEEVGWRPRSRCHGHSCLCWFFRKAPDKKPSTGENASATASRCSDLQYQHHVLPSDFATRFRHAVDCGCAAFRIACANRQAPPEPPRL